MAEIIHRRYGDRPKLTELDPPCAVYEWKASGELDVEQLPGYGSWSRIPDVLFDRMVEAASRTADHLTYQRVYIIGRPE